MIMSRNLLKDNVTLSRKDGSKVIFHIRNCVGYGASCVVYQSVCDDNTEHLLKEYYPRNLSIERNSDGTLIVPKERREIFADGLDRFRKGNERQKAVRHCEKLKNYTSNVQGYFYGNGTEYIDMTVFSGHTYDKVESESLHTLFRRMRTLTQVIGYYHEVGLLHLDIKPENIFVRPDEQTCDDVILFDFDSVVEKKNITIAKNNVGKVYPLSYTKDWAAPEQLLPYKRNSICEATDLFSIGEIVFTKIFGRHSTREERRTFADYNFNCNSEIFKDINPKVIPLIEDLFRHTICSAVKNRYQSAKELIKKLDEAIEFTEPKETFLRKRIPSATDFFVGRDEEIISIHQKLQENNILFLNGIGGIGKSELAKYYAIEYSNEYDAIIFAPFVSDIQSLIIDDFSVPIYNFFRYPEESPCEYFERKMIELGRLCDERTLIIVDNLNTTEDPNLNKLFNIGCKMLITTRADFARFNQAQIKIDKLKNKADIRQIFDKYYSCQSDNESSCVDEIIETVDGHTFAVELIAKQIEAEWATADEILKKLKSTGISNIGVVEVNSAKDNKFLIGSAYDHIKSLFDLSAFKKNVDALYVLTNLALIPHTGIEKKTFAEWCQLNKHGGKSGFNNLVKSGWIRSNEENRFVSLHPIVTDILLAEFESNISADTIDFLYNAALSFYHFGNQKAHIFALNRAIDSFEKYKDTTKVDLGQLHNALGLLYKNIDEFPLAKIHYEKALSLAENHNFLIRVYSNLINLYCSLDRYDDAEEIYTQSLDRCKEIYKEDNLHVATIHSLLGVLNQKRDKFNEAERCFKKALDIRVNCLGKVNGEVAHSHNDLGALYHAWGRFVDAENEHKIALITRLQLYGEKHKDTIISYTNLAVSLIEQNRFDEAEGNINKALELCCHVYGESHSETATILNNVGFIYGKNGHYDLSEKYFKQALHIWEKIFNGIHTKIAAVKLNLGVFYREQKRYDESIQMLFQAKDIYVKIFKSQMHTSIATVFSALGKTYAMSGNTDAAYDYYQKALDIRKKFFDDGHEKIKIIKERINELKSI